MRYEKVKEKRIEDLSPLMIGASNVTFYSFYRKQKYKTNLRLQQLSRGSSE